MKYRLLILMTICFIGFVLVAGCTSQEETTTPPVTATLDPPVQTFDGAEDIVVEPLSVADPAEESESNGLFDLPLSSPPADLMVSVSTDKDPIYNTITVRFDGGRGQDLVSSAIAGVTFSDGRTETKDLVPTSGSTVTFEGTTGMDVVEVVISYMNGESYKVLQEAVGFVRANIGNDPVEPQETAAAPSGDIGYEGPVTTPPNDLHVSVNVEKDTVYKTITTTFDGGLGQNLVQRIDVLIMLSDGSFFEGVLEPRMGATVEVDGTSGTDRVQVVVAYLNGEVYKIIDAELGARGGTASN